MRMIGILGVILGGMLALVGPAAAAPHHDTVAVIVGANLGTADDEPLRYAESDARRIRELLIELGGVRPERAILVERGTPDQVVQAINQAMGRAAEMVAAGSEVAFLFYYSGHGDDQALHLSRGTVSLAELRQLVARVPASVRVSILDACRTGGHRKGTRRGPSFGLAVAPDSPHGTVVLRAASVGEAAQESEELGSAVFTHFLVSGLRGAADSDGDGQVTLAELYGYAYRKTLLRTGLGAAAQHPSLELELAGAGELVLSRLAKASGFVELPAGADRYLVFSQPGDTVLGEVGGDGGQLALPAGHFLVIRRTGGSAAIALIDLSLGGRRRLRPSEFRPVAPEELVARGGMIELRRWRIEPQLGVELAPGGIEDVAVRAGALLGYSLGRFNLHVDPLGLVNGRLELDLEAAYVSGSISGAGLRGRQHTITGGPSLAIKFFPRLATLALMLGVELRYSWERLEYNVILQSTGPSTQFFSVGPRAGLRLTLPLGHHLTASVTATVAALLRSVDAAHDTRGFQVQLSVHPVVFFTAGLGYQF